VPPLGPRGAHLAERAIWKVGHFAFVQATNASRSDWSHVGLPALKGNLEARLIALRSV
jgi:hypothetical protein